MTLRERLDKANPKAEQVRLPEWRRRALEDQRRRGNVAVKEVAA
jgi:hypothetical protein